MTVPKFNVNNKIEIISDDGEFISDIQDVSESYLAISIPIKEFQYLLLKLNERIEVIYNDGTNIYKFNSTVIKRDKSNNIPLIWITIPKKFEKVQRRRFVRVPTLKTTKCAVIGRDFKLNKNSLASINFEEGTILDLSGSGTKLSTKLYAEKGNIIALIVPLGKASIIVKGEIKRVDLGAADERIYGVDFIDLSNIEREKIISVVFKTMRQQMKKGLKGE